MPERHILRDEQRRQILLARIAGGSAERLVVRVMTVLRGKLLMLLLLLLMLMLMLPLTGERTSLVEGR